MSPELQADLNAEAKAFGNYLLGKEVNARAVSLYLAAHDQTQFESDAQDLRILKFMLRHPSLIGAVDAGLAIRKNKSCVRKKLYYMLAILESMPEYAQHFLFEGMPLTNALRFFFFGARGVMRMIVGFVLCGVL